MIREHNLYEVTCTYRRQIRESDGGGGSDFVGYEKALFTDVKRILAPSEAYAVAWATDFIRFLRDASIVSVVNTGRIDAFIRKETW